MADISQPLQEICEQGDTACHIRNLQRYIDALNESLTDQIQDQTDTLESDLEYVTNFLLNNVDDIVRDELDHTKRTADTIFGVVVDIEDDLYTGVDTITRQISDAHYFLEQDHEKILIELSSIHNDLESSVTGMTGSIDTAIDNSIIEVSKVIVMGTNMLADQLTTVSKNIRDNVDNNRKVLDDNIKDQSQTIQQNTVDVGNILLVDYDSKTRLLSNAISDTNTNISAATGELSHMIDSQSQTLVVLFLELWNNIEKLISSRLPVSIDDYTTHAYNRYAGETLASQKLEEDYNRG